MSGNFDAGEIIDGEVVFDTKLNEYVIKDEDDNVISTQALLQKLCGKEVRFTLISFESIAVIEGMLVK